ncbi:MAG: hypothetical protein LBO65_00890 [Spirochaetaceae bacterium]|nr:hypothetical protein [Spirochaetaceae bacterium]
MEEILELATIENNGSRPRHIENEIYALFHHISRSLCNITNVDDAVKEVEQAKNSHLKRAILDSYKIAINSVLKESDKKTDLLEDLATDPDYRECINESIISLELLRKSKSEIKTTYLEAKKKERKGDMSEAVKLYNSAIEKIADLSKSVVEIEKNNVFRLAIKRIKKIERSKKKQNRFTLSMLILSCLLTALCSSFLTFFVNEWGGKLLPGQHTPPQIEAMEEK